MTKERREEILATLCELTLVPTPCIEDGPEILRDKMQQLHRVLDKCSTFIAELTRARGVARSCLMYVEAARRTGERDPQLLQDAKQEFHEISDVMQVAHIRHAEVRGLLKDLRSIARLMENMYAVSTTGIWSLKTEGEMTQALERERRKGSHNR